MASVDLYKNLNFTLKVCSKVKTVPYRYSVKGNCVQVRNFSKIKKLVRYVSCIFMQISFAVSFFDATYPLVAKSSYVTIKRMITCLTLVFLSVIAFLPSICISFSPLVFVNLLKPLGQFKDLLAGESKLNLMLKYSKSTTNAFFLVLAHRKSYRLDKGQPMTAYGPSKLIDFCSKAMPVVIFIIILPLGSFLTIRRGADPFYFMLKHIHPQPIKYIDSLKVFKFLRFAGTWWFCSEIGMCISLYFSIAMILCKSVNHFLITLARDCPNAPTFGKKNNMIILRKNGSTRRLEMEIGNSFRSSMRIYNIIRVYINGCFGTGGYLYYQNLMLLGGCVGLSAVCNYTFIKLQGNLGWSMRLASPCISASAIFISNSLVPEIVGIHEESIDLLRVLKNYVRTKYDRKICDSLYKVGIPAGGFFTLKKSTKPNLTKLLVDCTVTLLLSF